MKRICCLFLFFALLVPALLPLSARAADFSDEIRAKSAILMEASTGTVLYEFHADDALPPASVTKVMTMLLVMEAVDSGQIGLSDTVTVSDYASGMGGSQVYLKAGETMSVDDLLKSVAVASANDAAVALAEYVCGSEASFVSRMNERAAELGMVNTVFKNTNGLDDSDEGHLTSARDIACMSRELMKHEKIFDYTTIWMDSIRDGAFGLTNTNRLVRFYRGCNGLKTGSTSKAGFCISAAAKRDGMQLICVIMGAPDRDTRNALAASLMDWGFAGWTCARFSPEPQKDRYVLGGINDFCPVTGGDFSCVLPKGSEKNVTKTVTLPDTLTAPIEAGQILGTVTYASGETVLGVTELRAGADVPKIGFGALFLRMLRVFF